MGRSSDYPVLAYKNGIELPQEGTYYVVAENGCFLHKDNGVVSGFVSIEDIPSLENLDAKEQVSCSLPKLPEEFTYKIQEFFKGIVAKLDTEASVTLYFNKNTQEYKLHVPHQKTGHGSVGYKTIPTPEEYLESRGFLCVGTIHSHCNFSAFHSSTDIGDEEDFDGLHVTFGNNDKEVFTISASIVMNGHRKQIPPTECLEGVTSFEDSKTHFVIDDNENKKQWSEEIQGWFDKVTKVHY